MATAITASREMSMTRNTGRYKRLLSCTLAVMIGCFALCAPAEEPARPANPREAELAREIRADRTLDQVHQMAQNLLKSGINAGSGYNEVWIRDLNTFIEMAIEVNPPIRLRESLLMFLKT